MPDRPRVGFLGPEGSFTSEAASLAAPAATRVPLPTIEAVVDATRGGQVDLGVVPIENSIEGSVNVTLDALAFGPPGVFMRGEVTLSVSMNLLARPGVALEQIIVVRSHPHALAQSRAWLQAHLPHAAVEAATSTAEGARLAAADDGPVAALGTRSAAARYGLAVLATDVQDHDANTTRFVVLAPQMHARTGADKTSLVVFFGEDRPGLLLRTLHEFALRGINLTKVESRPTKKSLGEYAIFIDCAGHPADARVGEALRGVHRHVAELKVLGAYPRVDGMIDTPSPFDSDDAYALAHDWYGCILDAVDAPGAAADAPFKPPGDGRA